MRERRVAGSTSYVGIALVNPTLHLTRHKWVAAALARGRSPVCCVKSGRNQQYGIHRTAYRFHWHAGGTEPGTPSSFDKRAFRCGLWPRALRRARGCCSISLARRRSCLVRGRRRSAVRGLDVAPVGRRCPIDGLLRDQFLSRNPSGSAVDLDRDELPQSLVQLHREARGPSTTPRGVAGLPLPELRMLRRLGTSSLR
jgi:hypothetical protein